MYPDFPGLVLSNERIINFSKRLLDRLLVLDQGLLLTRFGCLKIRFSFPHIENRYAHCGSKSPYSGRSDEKIIKISTRLPKISCQGNAGEIGRFCHTNLGISGNEALLRSANIRALFQKI